MKLLSLLIAVCCTSLYAAEIQEGTANPTDIRIVSVDPTPEPDHVNLRIVFPQEGDLKTENPVKIQTHIQGFPLGTNSDFARASEVWNNNNKGQSLHVFIDDRPFFEINEALIDSLDNNENYYDQTSNFNIPFDLSPGMHVIRIFPARSFCESLKGDGCFAATTFYFKTRKDNPAIDLSKPYLTYNIPNGTYKAKAGKPILLDFYITNCQLSRDGYKVRFSIDGKVQRTLTQWVPYYIYGLKQGTHNIRLELLNPQNNRVPGPFNDVTRQIIIK